MWVALRRQEVPRPTVLRGGRVVDPDAEPVDDRPAARGVCPRAVAPTLGKFGTRRGLAPGRIITTAVSRPARAAMLVIGAVMVLGSVIAVVVLGLIDHPDVTALILEAVAAGGVIAAEVINQYGQQ